MTQRIHQIIAILSVLGILVAGYLTWTHLRETAPYCGASSSCADVQNSSYAEVVGIPISVIGLAGYAVLLVLSLSRGRVSADLDVFLPVLSFGAALVGVLYSGYLTYLEAYVIRAWCYWCIASAILILAVWFLTILDLRRAWVEG
jgi:uncharacterized membrane protein